MHLIIDGYNLLHVGRPVVQPDSMQLQNERDRLIDQLSAYRRHRPLEITIVFDGWQSGSSSEKREKRKGIEVIFSKLGEKADEVIKRIVRQKGAAVTLISSDRELKRYAERMAVAAVPSAQFREKMDELLMRGKEDLQTEEEIWEDRKKGPSRKRSKREKRLQAALRKL